MNTIYLVSLIGTAFFGITGALAAIEHRMDIFGVLAIAFIVGNGGGTMRSTILNLPPFWLKDPNFIFASIIPAFILFFFLFYKREATKLKKLSTDMVKLINHSVLITDAFGLGFFSIVGTQIALSQGTTHLAAIIMGMISAVGGGVIRDILCNQVPLILRHEVYAAPALLGGALYIWFTNHLNHNLNICLVIIIVATIRLLAVYRSWKMPLIYKEPKVND